MSSAWIPQAVQDFSIWGGTGWMLETLHMTGLPYWACFSVTGILLRTSLIPFVLHTAHMAVRFAKISPEIQFLVSIFQKDLKKNQAEGASFGQQWTLTRKAMQTVRGIYAHYHIRPFAAFYSPMAQFPVFMYVATDLRKLLNGGNPELAQELTQSGVAWIPDLTEPDPWFTLPALAGMLLYINMEVALGTKTLSGEATSKTNMVRNLKDFFQMVAVFMPCFISQQPAGIQIYLCTSFLFTLGQGAALRHDGLRQIMGLPKMGQPPPDAGELSKEFMELKALEVKAQEQRGDGPLLGKGVLAMGLEVSFAGTNRPSTIIGSNPNGGPLPPAEEPLEALNLTGLHTDVQQQQQERQQVMYPFIHGISAPPQAIPETAVVENVEYMPDITDDVVEAANRGERPVKILSTDETKEEQPLNAKKFRQRRKKKSGRRRK